MILDTVKRILKEDLARAGALPVWIDALLGPLNEFIEKIARALQGNLSFKDNFAAKIITLQMTHNTAKEISPGSKMRVTGVLLQDSGSQMITSFGWARKENGNLNFIVKFTKFDGTASTPTTMSFVVLLG